VTTDKAPRDPETGVPLSWKRYQTAPPTPGQLAQWFGHPEARGLGLVLSPHLPGRLACLDFDDPEAYAALDRFMREADDDLSRAWDKLHGWQERTRSGGVHLLFTIEDPPAIEKLEKIDTLGIGKASHCVMAPTPGYQLASADRTPARVTVAELTLITDTIRAQQTPQRPATGPTARLTSSGTGTADPTLASDDYNRRGDHRPVLEAHGWRYLFHRGSVEYWRRPGKDTGVSGTWGYAGEPLFHCFTTSTELESGKSYSLFALYTTLEHGGDYSRAFYDLRQRGYGSQGATLTAGGIKITRHGEIIRPGDPGYADPEPVDAPEEPVEPPEASQHAEGQSDGPTGQGEASEEPTDPEEPAREMLRPAGNPAELDPVLEDIDDRRRHYEETGSAIRGHRTGLDPLDDKLGGLEAGRVTILQAQPGAGKTTLSNQIAYTLAAAGVPVLYVSFENERADLIRKQLARIADVSPGLLDRGTLGEKSLDQVAAAARTFEGSAQTIYYLEGTAETTIETIKAALYYIRNQHPAAGHPVVMIDYLQQLARIAGGGPRDDMMTRVGLVSRGLTDLAKAPELRCHIWAISSMGRESYKNANNGNGKSPGMAAGKYSGDLEFDASAVLSLTKEEASQARDSNHAALSLGIVKNRYGETGTIELEQSLRSLAIIARTGQRSVHPSGSARERVQSNGRH
jgi:archaellum biogenesis ATPase FlaH